jgi:hypothetical protein
MGGTHYNVACTVTRAPCFLHVMLPTSSFPFAEVIIFGACAMYSQVSSALHKWWVQTLSYQVP